MKNEDREKIRSLINTALAIEMLEYEDKNYLALDNKRNCEAKMKLLKEAVILLEI